MMLISRILLTKITATISSAIVPMRTPFDTTKDEYSSETSKWGTSKKIDSRFCNGILQSYAQSNGGIYHKQTIFSINVSISP